MKTTRRNLLLGGLAAGAVSSAFLLKPKDRGADHTPYFRQLSKALDEAWPKGWRAPQRSQELLTSTAQRLRN